MIVALVAAIGCEPSVTSEAAGDSGALRNGTGDAGTIELVPFTLTLSRAPLPESIRGFGPVRLLLESTSSDARLTIDLALDTDTWPQAVVVEDVPPGRYRMVAYHDRDGDRQHDGCPFPPGPQDPVLADELDNIFGTAEAVVERGAQVDVRMERRVCGPGDPATGLRGHIRPPPSEEARQDAIYLYLEPLDPPRAPQPATATNESDLPSGFGDANESQFTQGGSGPVVRSPQRIPLFPSGLSQESDFELGQLLPGQYRAIFFVDSDGNGSPTLCSSGVGGADRFAAVVDTLRILPGQRAALEDIVVLAPALGCPDELRGLTGQIVLSSGIEAMLEQTPGAVQPLGLLAGQVRLAILSDSGESGMVDSYPLFPDVYAIPFSGRFTVTGLGLGDWRIVVFLDRDDDQQFGQCGGMPGGLDSVFHIHDSVRIEPGHIEDLGVVELDAAPECDTELGGIRGSVRLEADPGPFGSGRAVRLELYPMLDGVERRSFLLFENHRALIDPEDGDRVYRRFTIAGHGIPSGLYRPQIFLDTDSDGTYGSCSQDSPYHGDRAATNPFDIEIEHGILRDVGDHLLRANDCPLGARSEWPTGIEPTIIVSTLDFSDMAEHQEVPLRIEIVESGGWAEDRLLSRLSVEIGADDTDYAVRPEVIPVAPGEYRVLAYLDSSLDEAHQPCGEEDADPVSGMLHVQADEANPIVRPEIRLTQRCE